MNVVLVAGGSGGHIYPCLEMAKYFKDKGHSILLGGKNHSMEEKIYIREGLDFIGVDVDKHKIVSQFLGIRKILDKFKIFKPDAIILFGNYISVGFAIAAILKRIPIYLHEQNVIYGTANKLLGIFAKKIYLSLPIKKNIYSYKSLLVGNPKGSSDVRPIKLGTRYNVVVAMGSLGSSTINEILIKMTKIIDDKIDFHLVVGKKHYSEFINKIEDKDNVHVYDYIDNLPAYIKVADVFVSRAGATTISEILSNSVTSILIPSPYVKNNHQMLNAQYLLDNNACVLVEEEGLDAMNLNKAINELLFDYKKRLDIKMNAKRLAIANSKNKIYKDMITDYER